MRLVTFERRAREGSAGASVGETGLGFDAMEAGRPGALRLGALPADGPCAGRVVDLNRALAMKLAAEDSGAPEAEADSLLPPEALGFLARGEPALRAARVALDFVEAALARYDAPDLGRAGIVEPRERVRLRAPVLRPGKILAVARNYPAHAAESGQARPPGEPVLFLKAPSAVVGPEDDVALPAVSGQVDYEGELAAVIGRPLRDAADEDEALAAVAGYTAANDVSARDWQGAGGQHFIGKSCDTFAPLGPVLVTRDEIGDVQDLGLETRLCDEVVQSARTKEMTFPVGRLVAFASRLFTLEPGDVLLTGTPAGVGRSRRPPRWLREGDVVEVTVEGIGTLRNHVVAAGGRAGGSTA